MASIKKIKVSGTTYDITDSNAVHLTGSETIPGVKKFTSETLFTNSSYAPEWIDIGNGIGKSSCFTRGAFMQVMTGQILCSNVTSTTSGGKGYNWESGKIKFQSYTASNGQPSNLVDLAVISSDGITVQGNKVALEKDLPDLTYEEL